MRRYGAAMTDQAAGVELRRIDAEDWEAFRAVRLRALADSPTAFGVTWEEAASQPESVWRQRASGPGPILLGSAGERPVAMGGLHLPEGGPDAYVWGMWVEPASRGQGLAARMLDRLLTDAAQTGRPVVLHVTEGNAGARHLYERHGFVSTGEWQPLREGSDVRVETMRRDT